jgi:hypothetical protein
MHLGMRASKRANRAPQPTADSRQPFCLRWPWEIRCSLASSDLSLRRLRLGFSLSLHIVMALFWIVVAGAGIIAVLSIVRSFRDAALRRSGLLPATGRATMADVERLVHADQRILAIRCYREIHHVGLAEAKKAVDDLHAKC